MTKQERHILKLAREVADKFKPQFDYWSLNDGDDDEVFYREVADNLYEDKYQKFITWNKGTWTIEIDYENSFYTNEYGLCYSISQDMSFESTHIEIERKQLETLFSMTDEEIKAQCKKWFEDVKDCQEEWLLD